MASTIALRRRIKSVKSTRQITKAMELVSASKMRRAQDAALASREYALMALQILTRLRELTDVRKNPLYTIRTVKKRMYVVITSDRGLAGAYNSNVLRAFAAALKQDQKNGITCSALLIGKQASRFAARIADLEVLGAYDHMPEKPSLSDFSAMLSTIKTQFVGDQKHKPNVDAVDIIYTNFKSSIVQQVTESRLLPAAFTDVKITADLDHALFEPDAATVLEVVTERLIEIQLFQSYLESQASEQSSRMLAMKTASDNAGEIIEDLTLAANTARQSAITQELAEITGGVEAMK